MAHEPRDKKIGLVSCVAFAVGTMVGAGVFVLSGLAVEKAGPAALGSFAPAAVLVLLSALSLAVVASLARSGDSPAHRALARRASRSRRTAGVRDAGPIRVPEGVR
jgi:amino acid transporter